MGKIIGAMLAWLTKKLILSVLYYSMAFIYFLSVIAMITAFFVGLDFFISLIRDTLSMVGGYSGGGSIIGKFYAVLSCVGITSAINDAAPVLASAIIFLLARILIIQVNKVFKVAFNMLSSAMIQASV